MCAEPATSTICTEAGSGSTATDTDILSDATQLFSDSSSSTTSARTLAECITISLQQNHAIGAQENALQIARFQHREARTAAGPRVNLQNIQTHVHTLPGFGNIKIGQQDSNISKAVLQQPLYTFGRIESGIKMIDEQVKAEECALSAKKEDIVLAVVKAYLEVLKARNRAGIASESHRVISEHLQLNETLFKAGVVLSTDVAATRVKQLEAEQKLVEEENAVHIAEEELSHLLNLPTGELGPIADIPLGSLSLPAAATTTLQLRRPSAEIQRVDALLRLLKNRHFIEKRGQYPIVSLQATYETGNQFTEHQKNWNAVVVLDFPVFDSGATRARARQVQHEIAKTSHARAQVEQSLDLAVQTSFLRVQELEKKIGLAMQTLQTAQENLDQNRINYREGTALNTDVLNAELLLRNAKVAYSNAFFDYIFQQTALYKNLGRLPDFLQTILGIDVTLALGAHP